jgi:hypothetical protein
MLVGALLVLGLFGLVRPAVAGPPFLCHPFDIGAAVSLPWDESVWWRGQANYDVRHLVADTLGLLTPSTPVIVRMETLRRATLYATRDQKVAKELFEAITDHARMRERHGDSDALAWFDAGYVAEAFAETGVMTQYRDDASTVPSVAALSAGTDPPAMLGRSLALSSGDSSIEFAISLISRSPGKQEHALKARAGIAADPLLARNVHLWLD